MKGLSSCARVSLKQAIRYQTGLNSGSVKEYYERHFPDDNWRRIADKSHHSSYMELGFTPKDLILMRNTFLK
ncbi:hypothetical protein [Pseudoalteromonas phage PH357]|nr:hypothetical protein [Pseudoalteromonas phage PH357]